MFQGTPRDNRSEGPRGQSPSSSSASKTATTTNVSNISPVQQNHSSGFYNSGSPRTVEVFINNTSNKKQPQQQAAGGQSVSGSHSNSNSNIHKLQNENVNLRMRLMYFDEIMAKRGLDGRMINMEIDLRIEIDRLKKTIRVFEEQWEQCQTANAEISEQNVVLKAECATLAEALEKESSHRDVQAAHEVVILQQMVADLQQREVDWQQRLREACEEDRRHVLSYEALLQEVKSHHDIALQRGEQKEIDVLSAQQDCRELQEKILRLEATVAKLNKIIDEKDDQLALIAHDKKQSVEEQDKIRNFYRQELKTQQEVFDAEHHRYNESIKSLAGTEEILMVYKKMFRHFAECVRCTVRGAGGFEELGQEQSSSDQHESSSMTDPFAAGTSPLKLMATSTISSNGEGKAEGEKKQPPILSAAACTTAEVLGAAIDDCLVGMKIDLAQHVHFLHRDVLQKHCNSSVLQIEDSFGMICAKLRRTNSRLYDVAERANLLVRKKLQQRQVKRETEEKILSELMQVQKEAENKSMDLQNAKSENLVLQKQVRQLNLEKEAQDAELTEKLVEKTGSLLKQCKGTIHKNIEEAVNHIRSVFVDTNTLTPEFVASIKSTVQRTSNHIASIHDILKSTKGVSQDQQTQLFSEEISTRAHSMDHLANAIGNISTLLDNNIKSGEENRNRLIVILDSWETDILNELVVFEKRFFQLATKQQKMLKEQLQSAAAKAMEKMNRRTEEERGNSSLSPDRGGTGQPLGNTLNYYSPNNSRGSQMAGGSGTKIQQQQGGGEYPVDLFPSLQHQSSPPPLQHNTADDSNVSSLVSTPASLTPNVTSILPAYGSFRMRK